MCSRLGDLESWNLKMDIMPSNDSEEKVEEKLREPPEPRDSVYGTSMCTVVVLEGRGNS